MLRADAPAFVPSFDTCERITTSHQPLPSSNAQKKAKSRPRSRRHKKTDDGTSTTTRDSQDAITEESKRRKNRKTKNRSRHRSRRTSEHDSERVSHVADEELHPLTGDSFFPPLVSEIKNPIARTPPHHDRDWSLVAERAHELEKEQCRKEAANVLLATGSVRLVPLVRSMTCNVSSVSTKMDHESDETHQVPTLKLRHNVAIDINKLRNRWWDLIRENHAKNFLERQRPLVEDTCSSESSESWEEDLVETVAPDKHAEHVLVDPLILETCFESSYPLHRAVLDDDERAIRVLRQADGEPWLDSFVEPRLLGIKDSVHLRAFDALSPLQLAVYVDKPQLIKILYNASPSCDPQGRTALMLAAEMGLEACIKALLTCGASLLDKDEIGGDTAIHYACREGCTSSALRVLLSSSTRSNLMKVLSCKNRKGQTPLHVACEHGHVHVMDTFLSVCSSSLLAKLLHIHDDLNQTPLLAAVRSESTDVVMSLLMWRGNDQVGKHAATELSKVDSCPLTCAASAGSIDMVLLLLEFMDPVAHEASYTLDGSLHAAVRSTAETRFEIMRVLVEAGANPCAPSPTEPYYPNTGLSIACAKGDVEGLTVLLDSHQSYTISKRLARRQDPKLRQLPESYFEAIEARENTELNLAMTNALLQSLFLSYMDKDSTSCRLSAAICLFHRGTKLNGTDFATMKASIESKRLLSAAEADVEDGGKWFASTYHHFMPECTKRSDALEGSYDRSSLHFWSQVLHSCPWMSEESDVQCSWMMVDSDKTKESVAYNETLLGDRVVLIAEGVRFLVDTSIVSRKSAKLAAAIRFEAMNQGSQRQPQVCIGISAHLCKWLLQHIYHGSIVSDWHPDPLQCASDLMDLAMVAEEFICPSLLRECEMRLLSADPFQCYCWSCCLAVRSIQFDVEGEPAPCVECLYRVQGPSRLLTTESALDALAVSQQLGDWGASIVTSVKWWSPSQCPGRKDKSMNQFWEAFEANQWSSASSFAYIKDAAIETVMREFDSVSKSESFLSQLEYMVDDGPSTESCPASQDRQAQEFLLQMCLDELAKSPRKRHSKPCDWICPDDCQDDSLHGTHQKVDHTECLRN